MEKRSIVKSGSKQEKRRQAAIYFMLKVCCSKCYKEDLLLETDKQICHVCGGKMIKATLSFKNIWINPAIPIIRIRKLIIKYGIEKVIHDTKLKSEREAWVTAIWALGLIEVANKQYWIEIETENATPDTYLYYLEQIDGNNHRSVASIEVTDWEEHTEDIFEIIKSKCSKFYPNYFTLLVYARNSNKAIELEKIFQNLQQSTVPFGDIWIIGALDFDNYQLSRVFPERSVIKFNLNESLLKGKGQGDFATFLKRGTGVQFTNLGNLYLPIPLQDL